ncbi:MAG: protein tyrosine phosphatase [Hyphomicrobiales bacterium]|nr:protein tyrosine phosphatase [Hyphomicrobiales bacterium]MBV8823467.1 protein tyrosine phosphatase [Hyphomicrobiales bacterium]
MIHVCSLARLHATVEETRARRVITLMRDVELVRRPPTIEHADHLLLRLDDISEHIDGYTMPGEAHVAELLTFVRAWDRAAPLVIHCYAGVSRSTAGAFVSACALNPRRAELEIAKDIRRLSPTATPNIRIVTLADKILGRDGRMVAAVEAIGRGIACYEGHPFRLDLI